MAPMGRTGVMRRVARSSIVRGMSDPQGVPAVAMVYIGAWLGAVGTALRVRLRPEVDGSGGSARRIVLRTLGLVAAFMGGSTVADVLPAGVDRRVAFVAGGVVGVVVVGLIAKRLSDDADARARLPASDPVSRDPGWGAFDLLTFQTVFRPIRAPKRRMSAGGSTLVPMRYLWLAFTLSVALYWFVLSFIEQGPAWSGAPVASGRATVFLAAVAGIAAFALWYGGLLGRRVVDAEEARLTVVYRTLFFARIAFAMAGPLLAFVGTFMTKAPWLYPTAMVLAAPALYAVAPTIRNLQLVDERRRAKGLPGSLYASMV